MFEFVLMALAATLPISAGAPSGYLQPQDQFAVALNDDSNHEFYVLVSITDGRNGETKSGCINANFLLGAIHIEQGLDYEPASIERAQAFALSAPSHRFTFREPKALSNVDYDRLGVANEDVCNLIRKGKQVFRAHHTREIIVSP